MPFNFRKPPSRPGLRSPGRSGLVRSREYYYSLFTTLAVKIVLFVFLWMLFGSAVRIMRTNFRNLSNGWRVVLPGAIAIIALLIGYHIYKNIMAIRGYNRELDEARRKSRGE
jgi:hypothetical protein